MGLKYVAWENKWEFNSIAFPEREAGLGGIDHLPPTQRDQIASSATVPLHKCCSDPTWLYRIYQDTIVDLEVSLSVYRLTRKNAVASTSCHCKPLPYS